MDQVQRVDQPLILVEVDPGIDDALALMVIFGAWKLGLIKVLGVICSNGNMNLTQACENTKKIMDASHIREDQIPVFSGVATAVIDDIPKDLYFGNDGFGDIQPPIKTNPRRILPCTILPEYINTKSKTPSKEVTYLSLGSLTFLMTFLLQQPYFKFKDIWIMGGNNLGVEFQEWNFHVDPEAVHFILRQSDKTPLYIGTFQNCQNIRPTLEWRRKVLGKIDSDIIRLLNNAEKTKLKDMTDNDAWLQYDSIVAVALVFPDSIIQLDDLEVNVSLGTNLKARSILVKGNSKVKSIRNLDLEKYTQALEITAKALA